MIMLSTISTGSWGPMAAGHTDKNGAEPRLTAPPTMQQQQRHVQRQLQVHAGNLAFPAPNNIQVAMDIPACRLSSIVPGAHGHVHLARLHTLMPVGRQGSQSNSGFEILQQLAVADSGTPTDDSRQLQLHARWQPPAMSRGEGWSSQAAAASSVTTCGGVCDDVRMPATKKTDVAAAAAAVPLQIDTSCLAGTMMHNPQEIGLLALAQAASKSSTSPSPHDAECTKCPYCTDRPAAKGAGKTRRRRNRSTERQRNRFVAWWKSLGYRGEKYCSRCSENFRDHLIRQTSNSAGCTRAAPCSDCSQILAHFPAWSTSRSAGDTAGMAAVWGRNEQKAAAKRKRSLLKLVAAPPPPAAPSAAV